MASRRSSRYQRDQGCQERQGNQTGSSYTDSTSGTLPFASFPSSVPTHNANRNPELLLSHTQQQSSQQELEYSRQLQRTSFAEHHFEDTIEDFDYGQQPQQPVFPEYHPEDAIEVTEPWGVTEADQYLGTPTAGSWYLTPGPATESTYPEYPQQTLAYNNVPAQRMTESFPPTQQQFHPMYTAPAPTSQPVHPWGPMSQAYYLPIPRLPTSSSSSPSSSERSRRRPPSQFVCDEPECGRPSFTRLSGLERHREYFHDDVRWKCEFTADCSYTNRKDKVLNHSRKTHAGVPLIFRVY